MAFTCVMACTLAKSPTATLYTEGSDDFVASAAASIATGRSEPVPGWDSHPLKMNAFHGALITGSRTHGRSALCEGGIAHSVIEYALRTEIRTLEFQRPLPRKEVASSPSVRTMA